MIRWAEYAGVVLVAAFLAWPSAVRASHWAGPEHGVCKSRTVLEAWLEDKGQRRVGFGLVPEEVADGTLRAIYRLDLWSERDDPVFTWVIDIDAQSCVVSCLLCMLMDWGMPGTAWVRVPWRP